MIKKKLENDWNPGTWVLIWEYTQLSNEYQYNIDHWSLVLFTLQRNLRTNMRRPKTLGLFAAASLLKLTGWFYIHLFLFI